MSNRNDLLEAKGARCPLCGEERFAALTVRCPEYSRAQYGHNWESYYKYLHEEMFDSVEVICRNCIEVQKVQPKTNLRKSSRTHVVRVGTSNATIGWLKSGYILCQNKLYYYPEKTLVENAQELEKILQLVQGSQTITVLD